MHMREVRIDLDVEVSSHQLLRKKYDVNGYGSSSCEASLPNGMKTQGRELESSFSLNLGQIHLAGRINE